VFVVGELVEGWALTPRLVGGQIGLHPVAVIFAVMAGGQLYGFFGILCALPVVAMVLVRHVVQNYRASMLYGYLDPKDETLSDKVP
jgi:predicted PurR-regulated permease PerM